MSPSIWSACQVQLSSIGGAKSWTRKSLLTIWDLQYLNFVYVRAYFCIFGTTFLYPKHLKHILHHLQRTKKLDPQAHPLGRDPKCRKGKIVFPVELSKVLLIYRLHWRAAYNCESKLQISDFWGQRSWQLEVFLSWMYCAISQLKCVIHFRERVKNPQKCRDHRQKPFLFASEAVRAVKRARIQREKDAKKQKATEQRILFLKSFFCTSSAFQVTKSKGRSFTKKVF